MTKTYYLGYQELEKKIYINNHGRHEKTNYKNIIYDEPVFKIEEFSEDSLESKIKERLDEALDFLNTKTNKKVNIKTNLGQYKAYIEKYIKNKNYKIKIE